MDRNKWKNWLEKLRSGEKMPKKNHLLILFLIGMLLFVAVIPLPSSDQADTSAESESVSTAGVTGTSLGEYETYI